MKQSYLQFDFSNFNAKGLRSVISALGRSKVPVIKDDKGMPKVEGNNRITRRQGVPTKTAILYLMDGQSITLSATSEGSIYQVKLNGQVLPVKNVDDLGAAVKEVAAVVRKNSSAFSEKLAKQAVKAHAPKDDSKKTGRGANSVFAKLKLAKEHVVELKAELDTRQKSTQEIQLDVDRVTQSVSDLESKISEEKARNERLTKALAA